MGNWACWSWGWGIVNYVRVQLNLNFYSDHITLQKFIALHKGKFRKSLIFLILPLRENFSNHTVLVMLYQLSKNQFYWMGPISSSTSRRSLGKARTLCMLMLTLYWDLQLSKSESLHLLVDYQRTSNDSHTHRRTQPFLFKLRIVIRHQNPPNIAQLSTPLNSEISLYLLPGYYLSLAILLVPVTFQSVTISYPWLGTCFRTTYS